MGYGQYSNAFTAGRKWKPLEQLSGERWEDYRKAGHNRVLWLHEDGSVRFRLHLTDVVIWHKDGSVTVQTGGFETVTTRKAITEALLGFNCYGNKGKTILERRSDGQRWSLEGGKVTIAARYGVRAALHACAACLRPEETCSAAPCEAVREDRET